MQPKYKNKQKQKRSNAQWSCNSQKTCLIVPCTATIALIQLNCYNWTATIALEQKHCIMFLKIKTQRRPDDAAAITNIIDYLLLWSSNEYHRTLKTERNSLYSFYVWEIRYKVNCCTEDWSSEQDSYKRNHAKEFDQDRWLQLWGEHIDVILSVICWNAMQCKVKHNLDDILLLWLLLKIQAKPRSDIVQSGVSDVLGCMSCAKSCFVLLWNSNLGCVNFQK